MIKLTATQHKEQKVAVFVDVQNMYYSAKNLYNSKVNFSTLLREAVKGRRLVRAFAYVIKADMKLEKSFFDALEMIGYEVKAKDLQTFYGGQKKGDWDVGISMDIVRLTPKVDTIILVSGDGDFKELLEYASANGCRTEVIAFGRSSSSKLKEQADLFYDLDTNKAKFLIKGKPTSISS